MIIRLRLTGPLRLPSTGRLVEWKCRRGTSVKTILRRALGYSSREMGFIQVFGNGRLLKPDETLNGDAELQVTLRLGGG